MVKKGLIEILDAAEPLKYLIVTLISSLKHECVVMFVAHNKTLPTTTTSKTHFDIHLNVWTEVSKFKKDQCEYFTFIHSFLAVASSSTIQWIHRIKNTRK